MRFAWVLLLGIAACGPAQNGQDGKDGKDGAEGAPGAAGTTGQDILEAVGSGQIVVTGVMNYTVIPGLTITANVPASAKLHVDTNGGIQCMGMGNTYAVVDVAIFVDGTITNAQRRVVAANTVGVAQMLTAWSFGRYFFLPAGMHTIDVRVAGVDMNAAPANVSSAGSPQLQGVLGVTILKL